MNVQIPLKTWSRIDQMLTDDQYLRDVHTCVIFFRVDPHCPSCRTEILNTSVAI